VPEDPSSCLGALSDGVELRGDLEVINGQVFAGNASFGAYAEVAETRPAVTASRTRRRSRSPPTRRRSRSVSMASRYRC
jgi:hypothetical protein